MADLLQMDTDEEIDKYDEATLIASNPPPLASTRDKMAVYNPLNGRNDVLVPLSLGGYVKLGEEPVDRLAEVRKYADELQQMEQPFDIADFEAAGFTQREVEDAGIMPQRQEKTGRTEPLREGEELRMRREGAAMVTPDDPTMRQDLTRLTFENTEGDLRQIFEVLGIDRFTARKMAEGLWGNPESTRDLGLGIADFTPAGLFFGAQEGMRTFQRGRNTGDPLTIGMGALEAGLSFLEALPLTAAGAKGLKASMPAMRNALTELGRRMNQPGDMPTTSSFGVGAIDDAPSATTPNQAGSAIKLYHGTDAPEFEQFDPSQARTAKHIYTSPIRDDAAAYGRNVLEFETDANILDLRADTRGINETKVLRQVYDDGGLNDYFESFDDFVDTFDSGDMYQRFGSQNVQNAVIDELFAASSADGLRIPDAGFGGALSESVVFEDPAKLQKVTEEPAKPSAAELRRQANIQRFGYDPNDPVAEVKVPTETEPGIIAFHGSGADFDEFKLEKIGTGEGAQAFGYGLYFTDKEDIAKFYRDSVGAGNEVTYKGKVIQDLDQDFADENNIAHMAGQQETPEDMQRVVADEVRRTRNNLAGIEQSIKDFQENPDVYPLKFHGMEINMETAENQREFLQRRLDAALEVQDNIGQIETKPAGTMYQVGLHVNPDELIDYDKTFDEQSAFVQEAILKVLDEVNLDDAMNMGIDVFSPPYNGNEEQALQATKKLMLDNFSTVSFLNDWSVLRGAENSGEELLEKHGVKGITYKAQRGVGARNVPETGSDNYVIFDDKLISIMKKYGIVGPVAVSAMTSQKQEEI